MPTRPCTGRAAVVTAVLAVLAVLAVSTVLQVVVAAPAAAVEAQGLRVDPVEPDLIGHASFLQPAIPPGGAATYALRVRNLREEAVEVLVYGADLVGTRDVATGTDNEEAGAWITADRPRLEIAGRATEEVRVTIARPAGDQDGGRGAIVVQLSEATRQDLALERIERAALRVEVAADGSGHGVHVTVTGTEPTGTLVPGTLDVPVRFAVPDGQRGPVSFHGTVVLSRPLVADPAHDMAAETLPAGGRTTSTVAVDLPWYGVVGHLTAEAAVPGLTTRSAPVRVLVVPPWLALLLVVAAGGAVLRLRRTTQ